MPTGGWRARRTPPRPTCRKAFTDARARDAVGAALDGAGDVPLTYDGTFHATLSAAVQASLDAADSAVQPGAGVSVLANDAGYVDAAGAAAADISGKFIGGVELTSSFVSTVTSAVIVKITGMQFSFLMPDRPVMISFGSTAFYDSTTSTNLAAIILRVNGTDTAQLFFSAAITNYWSQGKQYALSGVAPGTSVTLEWWLNMGEGTFTVFGNTADKPYIYVVTL